PREWSTGELFSVRRGKYGSLILCVISRSERVATSLTYIESINLCVLCVSVVPSTRSPAGLYLRIHFTHRT
ncbi:MAG: hypothetical protein ACKO90_10620, partial [Microcystis panniformis]